MDYEPRSKRVDRGLPETSKQGTPVVTTCTTPIPVALIPDWAASKVHELLIPGNAGAINYKYLNGKVKRGEYEPVSNDVDPYLIESAVESMVGVHVYPATNANVVIFFHHGNILSPCYLNPFMEKLAGNCQVAGKWLPENRKFTVVACDFPGYHLSPRVPNKNGGLEIAAIANYFAVVKWAERNYPGAELVSVGRSIGTYGWVNQVAHPLVSKAIGIVPFAEPAPLLKQYVARKLHRRVAEWISADRVLSVVNRAFPRGCESPVKAMQGISTKGFAALAAIEDYGQRELLQGKEVLIFVASQDKLVPSDDAKLIKAALQRYQCTVEIRMLKGGHNALPGDEDNTECLEELKKFCVAKSR